MYRLKSPFETNDFAVEFIKDNTVIVIYATILGKPNPAIKKLKLKGLNLDKHYKELTTNKTYSGDFLQKVGIVTKNHTDFESGILVFEKVELT